MSDDDARPTDFDETVRLVTVLAGQLLASQTAEGSMPPERLRVLISAAQFLHDNDVPWPAVVREAMGRVADQLEAAKSASGGKEADT